MPKRSTKQKQIIVGILLAVVILGAMVASFVFGAVMQRVQYRERVETMRFNLQTIAEASESYLRDHDSTSVSTKDLVKHHYITPPQSLYGEDYNRIVADENGVIWVRNAHNEFVVVEF